MPAPIHTSCIQNTNCSASTRICVNEREKNIRTPSDFSQLLQGALHLRIAPVDEESLGGIGRSERPTGCTGFPEQAGTDEQTQLERMWEMQAESHIQNLELIGLQQSVQSENQRFAALSNLLKSRHDTAKAAISNMRV